MTKITMKPIGLIKGKTHFLSLSDRLRGSDADTSVSDLFAKDEKEAVASILEEYAFGLGEIAERISESELAQNIRIGDDIEINIGLDAKVDGKSILRDVSDTASDEDGKLKEGTEEDTKSMTADDAAEAGHKEPKREEHSSVQKSETEAYADSGDEIESKTESEDEMVHTDDSKMHEGSYGDDADWESDKSNTEEGDGTDGLNIGFFDDGTEEEDMEMVLSRSLGPIERGLDDLDTENTPLSDEHENGFTVEMKSIQEALESIDTGIEEEPGKDKKKEKSEEKKEKTKENSLNDIDLDDFDLGDLDED